LIEVLEEELGRTVQRRMLPMQPGDVPASHADIGDLSRDVGFSAGTPLEVGVSRFIDWYCEFYGFNRAGPKAQVGLANT
jgi:UDP-glucuronate 4-epimerase